MSLATPDLSTPPYLGPASFTRKETLYGRDREAQELSGLLISERIVLLYSPSGAGKTSLLQARVIPELERREFVVRPVIRVSRSLPTSAGNRYLESVALSLQGEGPAGPGATLDAPPGDLAADEVLIFDQFEEILTLDPTDIPAKRAFFQAVGRALLNRRRWALFAMREEYVAALDPFLRFVPTRLSATFRLDLLGERAAAQAISGPAAARGVLIEPAAVARLVDDLRRIQVQGPDGSAVEQPGPYVEPVQLQVVCLRLWRDWLARRAPDSTTITAADLGAAGEGELGATGSVGEALRAYYDESVARVAASAPADGPAPTPEALLARERAVRDFFDRQLITADGIRGQVLQGYRATEGLPNDEIRELVDAYLVRSERRGGRTWYELAHDRLIRPVRLSNAAWKREHLVPAQTQATVWDDQGRPPGLLLRDEGLRAAEAWAAQPRVVITPLEREYLEACRALARAEARERRRNRLIRVLAVLASVVAVIAIGAAVLATMARNEATARQLVAQSAQDLAASPPHALLLANEALAATGWRGPLPEALGALYDGLAQTGGVALPGPGRDLQALAVSPDGGLLAASGAESGLRIWRTTDPTAPPTVLLAEATITQIAFSPDGRSLAAALGEQLLLWPADDLAAAPRRLTGHEVTIDAMAFSPDGAQIATGDALGAIRVWSLATGEARELPTFDTQVAQLLFAPDGRTLAAAAASGALRLVALDTAAEGVELAGHSGRVTALAFSPAGELLASGDDSGALRIWSRAGRELLRSDGRVGGVTTLAFSPDGATLAAGADDGSTQLWAVDGQQAPSAVLQGHSGAVTALAFDGAGAGLLSAGLDRTLQLSPLPPTGAPPLVLQAHASGVRRMALHAMSGLLATGASDGEVRLWDTRRLAGIPLLRGAPGPVAALRVLPDAGVIGATTSGAALSWDAAGAARGRFDEQGGLAAALSGDGALLALVDAESRLQLVDLRQTAPITRVLPTDQPAYTLAFSPDDGTLAAGLDGVTLLWSTADPTQPPTQLVAEGAESWSLAFSPDGRTLAAGDGQGNIWLWQMAAPAQGPRVLNVQIGPVQALAFSPDGGALAAGGIDGSVVIRRLHDDQTLATLRGHDDGVRALAYSDDGRLLASGGADNAVRLWATDDLRRPSMLLRGHSGDLLALAFSPDSASLWSGAEDGLVRRWPLRTDELLALSCATAGRNLTLAEWTGLFDSRPYERSCVGLPVSPTLVEGAAELLVGGDAAGAAALLRRVEQLNATNEIPGATWALHCRAAALFDQPQLSSCDRAVALAPADGRSYDSRAIARMRAGDPAGAGEDLRRFLAWAADNAVPNAEIEQRQSWIAALEAGQRPLDEISTDEKLLLLGS